jgi:hypothetical protein
VKPGDLVKTDPFLIREGRYYDLLSPDLYTRNGGIFHDDDVGLVLEAKIDVLPFCRVWTPRGDGWITESRLKRVR